VDVTNNAKLCTRMKSVSVAGSSMSKSGGLYMGLFSIVGVVGGAYTILRD